MFRERDWILRVTKEIAEFIARALKLIAADKRVEAIEVLEGACAGALGIEYSTLAFIDARSAVDLLGEPLRVLAFARLLEAMGEVEHRGGDPIRAEVRWRHALELLAVLLERKPDHTPSLLRYLLEHLSPRPNLKKGLPFA